MGTDSRNILAIKLTQFGDCAVEFGGRGRSLGLSGILAWATKSKHSGAIH